jgi:hypothetical protein
MNAKQAARTTLRVVKSQQEREHEAAQTERAQLEERAAFQARSIIRHVEKEIPKAARAGRSCVVDRNGQSEQSRWACSIAAEYFEKKGFKAKHADENTEMGDNEYPYTMKETILVVSWDTEARR